MENRPLYVVRHGKIQQEDDQRRYIGQIDLPLAAAGRQQARGLRSRFERAELGAVFCSDLSRPRETAEIIAGGAGGTSSVFGSPGARASPTASGAWSPRWRSCWVRPPETCSSWGTPASTGSSSA